MAKIADLITVEQIDQKHDALVTFFESYPDMWDHIPRFKYKGMNQAELLHHIFQAGFNRGYEAGYNKGEKNEK